MSKEVVLLLGQSVVVVVLGVLVALGHNNGVQDALIAVCGSIAGVGVYQKMKGPG